MKLFAPRYYQKFKCIADRCTHSCCVGWEIDVDEATLAVYRGLAGSLGDRIRGGIATGSEGAHFTLRPDGRCPNLDDRGLCTVISELGEGYLCDICREHPRFYNDLGDRTECGVGACCEAAAALILREDYTEIVQLEGELCCEKRHTCGGFDAVLQRKALYAVLADRTRSAEERFALIKADFSAPVQLSNEEWRTLFASLEYLNEEHRALFARASEAPVLRGKQGDLCEHFFAYLVYRHASGEETLQGFRDAVGLALILTRLFAALCAQGIACVEAAVTVSEELEYSEENTAAIRAALAGCDL